MTDVQQAGDTQEIATQPEMTLDEKRDRIEAIANTIKGLKDQLHKGPEEIPCSHCGAEVGVTCKTKLRKPAKAHNDRWTAFNEHRKPISDAIYPLDDERRVL